MARREEIFGRALDDMLAGRAAGPVAVEDAGLLEFGRRMAALRPVPRPAFHSRLKSHLLQQLAARQAQKPERTGWLAALLRRPLYAAAVAAVFVGLVFGSLWLSGVFSPSQHAAPEVVRVQAMTDRAVYARGEPVVIDVELSNVAGETLTFSEFPPIVSVMRETGIMAAYTFAAGEGTRTLRPGQSLSFSLTWDQRDARGAQVPAGEYRLELEDLYFNGVEITLAPESPVEFEIV